ncbi:amidohydrolase [Parvularcula maris]|uniref:Amidohydrolase n=1 Tax=Parvularcula maris TaxID=2965077 RepID=A0A9X2LBD8_9PROT|nr:amidohydrolase [Parvularcula maris]MCQ8186623.1 amidohydrolase [Parvularcula maris]
MAHLTHHPSRRLVLAYGGAASALAGLGPASAQGGGAPDLILFGGRLITQNPWQRRATAIAMRGGVITAVGEDSAIRELVGRGTEEIDLGGRTVIPGLNDSHLHVTRGGRFYATELRWDGVGSLARGLEMIREQAARTPEGQWVRVIGGWSPFQFEERRLPTPGELTEAAPDVPVYVLYLYSQGYLNKKAVEVRGLTPETEAPEGTRYEFTEDGGCILHAEPNPDLLYGSIGALPPLGEDAMISSTMHYYRELNRFGLTSAIDAGGGGHTFPKDYASTGALAAAGDLSLRVSAYLFPQNKGAELAEFEAWTKAFEAGVNEAEGLRHGYEVEGGGEFLAWSAGDYENFLAGRPDITTRKGWREDLLGVTRHLLKNRWPLRIHATYDPSVNHILGVFEEAHTLEVEAGREGFGGVRWAIDHGETLTPRTIQRIKSMGGGIAMQARMAYAGEYFLDRYGRKAADNAPPLRDVIDAGIPLGLGTDGTRVASYNPWPALAWAITGESVGGTKLHAGRHRLTREEALYHYTVGSAWFSQEERLKGRLVRGQYADLAVLNVPYLDVADSDLSSIEADLTITGGQVVHGQNGFEDLAPTLDPIEPAWSPVRTYGGYQR